MKTDKKRTKVLSLDIYFKLSDDFKGDYNDALFEYASYRLNKNTVSYISNPMLMDQIDKENQWGKFWHLIHNTDLKASGNYSVMEFDSETEEWSDIENESGFYPSKDLDKLHLKLMSEVKGLSEDNTRLREELKQMKLELEKAMDMVTRNII